MALESDAFTNLAQKAMEDFKVPGIAIVTLEGDHTRSRAFGVSDTCEVPMTADMLFNCASNTKSFVAAALALLVNDKEGIEWTTPVSKLLPDDFVLSESSYTEQVTVEDIVSHRSGLPSHEFSTLETDNGKSITRNLRNLPISAPIRTRFQYCNTLFVVAGYLVESLSGQKLSDFLKERIWDPLGMDNTYIGVSSAAECVSWSKISAGYIWRKNEKRYDNAGYDESEASYGAGEMYTSANNLAKYVRMMIGRSGPIPAEQHAELTKPRIPMGFEPKPFESYDFYALGWIIYWYRGYKVVSHSGYSDGFASIVIFIPEKKWGIVVFANSEGGGSAKVVLSQYLMDEMLEVPASERHDWYAERLEELEHKDDEEEDPYKDKRLPPSDMKASLEAHVGAYHNPGYKTLKVKIKKGHLFIDATDREYGGTIVFKHVSSEYFIAESTDTNCQGTSRLKAEFRVDPTRKVHQMGLALESDYDELIWFTRVDSLEVDDFRSDSVESDSVSD